MGTAMATLAKLHGSFRFSLPFTRRVALARQHRQLAELDDHMLVDIGLSRETAAAGAERPIWDAPLHWRC
jgi:uncharacterized protein YjiS (DUF1127 family)